jgi:hypothetical protein
MPFLHWLKDAFDAGFGLFWGYEEKAALLSVVRAVYAADGRISEDERHQWTYLARCLGLTGGPDLDTWTPMELGAAVAVLQPARLEVLYHWIAEAVYSDFAEPEAADLDAAEVAVLDALVERHGLDRARLDAAVRASRDERLAAILASFEKQIERSDY